jgi:hypothetical protein
MAWDRKVFRASQDAVGAPGDDPAVNSTDDNTMVALLKGLYALLGGTITVSLPTGGATSAKQDTGNTSLSSIDTKMTTLAGHVDGLEALGTALNGFVDGLEALIGTIDGRVDGLEALITSTNTKLDTLNASVGNFAVVDVTLSADTAIFASGDIIADTQVVANALRVTNGAGRLQSITVIDEDDQGAAFDLYFFSANNSMGSENSAPNISDTLARDLLTFVAINTGDYRDLGGVKVANLNSLNRVIKAVTGTTSIYVAAVNGAGTPTFTASGLKLRLGIEQA